MRVALAEKLLAKIMEWSPEVVSQERPLLQAMADFKYDEYQQYSPGIRFIESLARWLEQIKTIEERKVTYEFIKKQLIFISNNQITHLVNLAYSTIIRPIIICKVANQLNIKEYQIEKITNSPEYKEVVRQSLFIGLSDGSRIDQLRRYAQLDNEQVLTTYYIDDEKINDLKLELNKSYPDKKFTTIFLVDDFTASGTSYARVVQEKDSNITIEKGKILKLLNKIYPNDDNIQFDELISKEHLSIHIIFYLATEEAIENIKSEIEQYKTRRNLNIEYTIQAVQIIDVKVKNKVTSDAGFMNIIEKEIYFDKSIKDKHFLESKKNEKPFLGFNECALPLVLYHNTPNNSLPIIWFPEDKTIKGLFPRITRHKE